jgi:aminodeoxychorismate lyase
MIAYVQGRFVEESDALIPVFDRGFLYGDSLFETLRVANRRPFRWPLHIERFRKSATFLGLSVPATPRELRSLMAILVDQNRLSEGLLRITLSRGVGPRGYSPKGADVPTLVITAHELPAPAQNWRLRTASFRLAVGDRLTLHKVGSRVLNVLARAEAEAVGADEALLLNTNGEVVEAASANIFWVQRDVVLTTPSALGALPGVTRAVVLEICAGLGIPTQKRKIPGEALRKADAVFVTNAAHGIINVSAVDDQPLRGSPLVATLQAEYARLLARETGGPTESQTPDAGPGDSPAGRSPAGG